MTLRPRATDLPDEIEWSRPSGASMSHQDWHSDQAAAIAVYLDGRDLVDIDGLPVRDDAFYLGLNARADDLDFHLPGARFGRRWEALLDTASEPAFQPSWGRGLAADSTIRIASRSLVLLRRLG
jgi:glycogen operon protein